MSLSDTRTDEGHDAFGYDALDSTQLSKRFAAMVREVAFRLDDEEDFGALSVGHGVTINEVMSVVTELLHGVDVQVFELSMWQAFTGRTAPRNLRHMDLEDEDILP
jgi:hypothetical protein